MNGCVAAGGGDGNASDDDFQQAWSSAAEDSLVAAWTAAKAAGGQASLEHLALEVCAALGNTAVQVGGCCDVRQSMCGCITCL
jgi:hypothetical protein